MLKPGSPNAIFKAPYHGAGDTVAVIREAALRSQNYFSVRQFVEEVCGGLRTKDYLSEALALYHAVCARTRYMRDPRTVELVRAPYLVIEEMRAGKTPCLDCDDMAALLSALLLAAGAEARVVTVAFRHQFHKGERQFSHVFAQAKEPKTGKWITLDPVAGRNTRSMLGRIVYAKVWPVA